LYLKKKKNQRINFKLTDYLQLEMSNALLHIGCVRIVIDTLVTLTVLLTINN